MTTTIATTESESRKLENRKTRRASRYEAKLRKSLYNSGYRADSDDLAFDTSERGWAA